MVQEVVSCVGVLVSSVFPSCSHSFYDRSHIVLSATSSMRTEARMFSLEIDNQLAHIWRETTSLISRKGTLFVKQARHALLIKLVCLIVQCAFTGSGFFRPFGSRLSKKHEGAQPLIDLLLRPERILLNFLPIMGAFSALASASGHGVHLAKQDRLMVA